MQIKCIGSLKLSAFFKSVFHVEGSRNISFSAARSFSWDSRSTTYYQIADRLMDVITQRRLPFCTFFLGAFRSRKFYAKWRSFACRLLFFTVDHDTLLDRFEWFCHESVSSSAIERKQLLPTPLRALLLLTVIKSSPMRRFDEKLNILYSARGCSSPRSNLRTSVSKVLTDRFSEGYLSWHSS